MDQHNFDRLTRTLAASADRRTFLRSTFAAVASAGTIGLLSRRLSATAQTPEPEPVSVSWITPESECVMSFEVAVRQGPSADAEYRGLLYVSMDGEGATTGRLETTGGAIADVLGQVTGDAVSLRFQLPDESVLYGTGVVNGDLAACEVYDMGGPVVGPAAGDLGDWRTGLPLTIDPDQPPLCVEGDTECEKTPVPSGPEPTPEIPEFPGSCQAEPFTNCLYVCGSSQLRPRANECLDYCIEVFQC